MGGGEHRGAVRARTLQRHLHGAEAVAGDVGSGEHGHHPGRPAGIVGVDGADASVRVGRAHDDHVRLVGEIDVRVKATLAAQQADILEALDRLADAELAHAPRSLPQIPPSQPHRSVARMANASGAADHDPTIDDGPPAWRVSGGVPGRGVGGAVGVARGEGSDWPPRAPLHQRDGRWQCLPRARPPGRVAQGRVVGQG